MKTLPTLFALAFCMVAPSQVAGNTLLNRPLCNDRGTARAVAEIWYTNPAATREFLITDQYTAAPFFPGCELAAKITDVELFPIHASFRQTFRIIPVLIIQSDETVETRYTFIHLSHVDFEL